VLGRSAPPRPTLPDGSRHRGMTPLLDEQRIYGTVTNMIEAGLSEKEAMEISGDKTRAVFDLYHSVGERRSWQHT